LGGGGGWRSDVMASATKVFPGPPHGVQDRINLGNLIEARNPRDGVNVRQGEGIAEPVASVSHHPLRTVRGKTALVFKTSRAQLKTLSAQYGSTGARAEDDAGANRQCSQPNSQVALGRPRRYRTGQTINSGAAFQNISATQAGILCRCICGTHHALSRFKTLS